MSVSRRNRLAAVPSAGRQQAAVALVAACLALPACGSGDEATIPEENADQLLAQLDEIDQAVADADCSKARTDISQLTGAVNELPADVGVETKEALRQLTDNLAELTESQCEEPASGDTGETGVVPPPSEETETTTAPPVTEVPEEPAPTDESEGKPPEHSSAGGQPPEQSEGEGTGLPPEDDSSGEGSGGVGEEDDG